MADLTTTASRPGTSLAPSNVVGGIGGLVFVASVVVQNVIRGTTMPSADAKVDRVIAFYVDHHGAASLLAALYAVGAFGLALFVGGLLSRVSALEARGPAIAGLAGVAGVFALFTVSLAVDLSLSNYVHRGSPQGDSVSVLWTLHNATFGLLLIAIGISLAGLSAASAGQGILPDYWKAIGFLGGIALAVAGAATPALLNGSPIIVLGLVGFLAWLVFVAVTSVTLLRLPATL